MMLTDRQLEGRALSLLVQHMEL